MKRFIVACFLIMTIFDITGQVNKYGVPFIQTYSSQLTLGAEQSWCIVQDISGNMYFGSQDRGVLRYDGTRWSAIDIGNNPRIYSLATDERGIVYVGGAFEFGYLQPGITGATEYVSLAERVDSIPEIRIIWSIEVYDEKVFFLGPKFIYVYGIGSDSLSKIDLSQYDLKDAFRLVRINDRFIIADNLGGIFELKDNSVSQLEGGDFFRDKHCTILLPFSEDEILIGTYFEGLFLYNYETGIVNRSFVDEQLNKKFEVANIYAGARVGNDLFAIGTTNQEGVLVFNRSGELLYQLNKETSDLIDDAVHSMYCNYNNDGELWIATYGYVNKAYLNLPLTKFFEKQGIDYGVNDIAEFGGSIYLSSDAGILKNYINENGHVRFRKVEGTDGQFFPLEAVSTNHDKFLLTGSLNGVIQIYENNRIREVEKNCIGRPGGENRPFNPTKEIVQSDIDRDIFYLGLESGGIIILKDEGNYWRFLDRIKGFPGLVKSIVEKKEGGLWFITDDPDALYNLTVEGNDTTYSKYEQDKGIPDIELNALHVVNSELYVTAANGILKYDESNDTFISDNSLTGGFSEGKRSQNLFPDLNGDIWYSGIDEEYFDILFRETPGGVVSYQGVLNLLPSVPSFDLMHHDGRVYITKSKTVTVLEKSQLLPDTTRVNTHFVSISVGTDSVVMKDFFHTDIDESRRLPEIYSSSSVVPEYRYDMNEITFEWTTPYFLEELLTEYSYKLEGYDEKWSEWESISFGYTSEALYPKKEYSNLPYGHYIFNLRTRTLTGQEGNEVRFEFVILKPWYATIMAFVGYALAAILIVWGIIIAYTRRLKNENIRLEGIVRERTAVVVKQKEELESSIHYASRIQVALLPSESILKENLNNYFVLFKPRDIVSGDFYWMSKKGDRLYAVAADCTGHGVPGAFMSLLGMSFLDEIIGKESAPRADTILNHLRLHVTESLKQSGVEDEAKDGMDIGILVFDINANKIEYSGAYNPCFKVRKLTEKEGAKYKEDSPDLPEGTMSNGKYLLETVSADKMPIGISSKMSENFTLHEWEYTKGVTYYLFSDGYVDQFGGINGRKYMKKNFKRFLLEIQEHPMDRQKELLDRNLIEWMGDSPQIDDVLVLGIRT